MIGVTLSSTSQAYDFSREKQEAVRTITKFREKAQFKDYVVMTFWLEQTSTTGLSLGGKAEEFGMQMEIIKHYYDKLGLVGSLETARNRLVQDPEHLNKYLDIIKHNLLLVGKNFENYQMPKLKSVDEYVSHIEDVIDRFSKINDSEGKLGDNLKKVVLDFIGEYMEHAERFKDANALGILNKRLLDSLNQNYYR